MALAGTVAQVKGRRTDLTYSQRLLLCEMMINKSIQTKRWWLMLAVATLYWASATASPIKLQRAAGSTGQIASPLYREASEAIKAHDHRRLQVFLEKNPSLAKSMPLVKSGRRSSLLKSAVYWEDEVSVRMLLEKGRIQTERKGRFRWIRQSSHSMGCLTMHRTTKNSSVCMCHPKRSGFASK